ncbi:MAG: sugar transferase [Candidatus Ornithospirochaeta sp.]|nr:sugar transferase [Sphaerochaetaceae bacterium]MDY5523334.1 sugar transferase [Candidatus Ornithospirochaeta sp.]
MIKRLFDIIVSFLGLLILSPLFLLLTILIKCDSKGPVFFIQKRVGRNGKKFGIFKFRTMRINAEELIASFTPEQLKEWKENFKLKNDPRITRVGKFLRNTSLDELPQLINIFIGNMSLVGPRPIVEEELEWYGEKKNVLLSVRPGLTGWWATNGRSEVSYPERCDYELYYVYNCSLLLDIKILFKTFSAVFSRKGAM